MVMFITVVGALWSIDSCTSKTAFVPAGVMSSRASASRRSLIGSAGLVLMPFTAGAAPTARDPSEPWRVQIPQTLEALRDIQSRWPEFERLGAKGAGNIRKVLDFTLVQDIDITVPAGQPVGASFSNRRVYSVKNQAMGWNNRDLALAVGGIAVSTQEALEKQLQKATTSGQPFTVTVARRRESPIDGIEEDLVQAYIKMDGRDLPDIDEVIGRLQAARMLSFGASSSARASGEVLTELRTEIDKLIPDLAQIVRAMG